MNYILKGESTNDYLFSDTFEINQNDIIQYNIESVEKFDILKREFVIISGIVDHIILHYSRRESDCTCGSCE